MISGSPSGKSPAFHEPRILPRALAGAIEPASGFRRRPFLQKFRGPARGKGPASRRFVPPPPTPGRPRPFSASARSLPGGQPFNS